MHKLLNALIHLRTKKDATNLLAFLLQWQPICQILNHVELQHLRAQLVASKLDASCMVVLQLDMQDASSCSQITVIKWVENVYLHLLVQGCPWLVQGCMWLGC